MVDSNPSSAESLFLAIGLEPKFVQQTLKNVKVTKSLTEVLAASKTTQCDKKTGFIHFTKKTPPPSL